MGGISKFGGLKNPFQIPSSLNLKCEASVQFAPFRAFAELRPEDGFAVLLCALGLRDLRADRAQRALVSLRAFVTFGELIALVIRFLALGLCLF